MATNQNLKLLVTIIKKGYSKKLVKEGKALGLTGSTVISGKGTVNPAMFESLLGLTYDPERDVVLSLVEKGILQEVKDKFIEVGQLTKKNTGIMFVIDVAASMRMNLSHDHKGGTQS